jgi:hypothetical protein
VLIAITIFTFIYQFFLQPNQETNETEKCIDLTITIKDQENIYNYCTEATYLGQLVEEHQEELGASFQGNKTDPYGRVLVSLQAYTIKANEFFFVYVNDQYGQYGIDQQTLEDGSSYELRLGTY